MNSRLSLPSLALAASLLLAGCEHDIPLTAAPTGPIDSRLLGNWASVDKDSKADDGMSVRRLDDSTYVVAVGGDIFRVIHTDVAGLAFVSAQDLNSDERKWVYYNWKLSADGAQLTLRKVSTAAVPATVKDTRQMKELIAKNIAGPTLFETALVFTRKKSGF